MATYNPKARYTWSPEDKFELNGAEFGLILNALRAVLDTPEAAKIMLAEKAEKAIENALAKAVEADIVKEAEQAPRSSGL